MTEHAIGLASLRLDQEGFRRAILGKLIYQVGKDPQNATRHDWFFALALTVRDRLVDGWMTTTRTVYDDDRKRVYYLSLEFLIGRLLADSLRNLGLYDTAAQRAGGPRRRRGRGAQGRARRRPGQWRPRPAGRLPARQHGHAGHRCLRLWHPLPARPVQAGPRRWLAGRAAGGLAGVRQSLGVRALRGGLPGSALRPGARGARRRWRARPYLGGRAARAGGRLRHAGGRLGRPAHQHAAPVVGAERQPDRSRGLQPRRLHARGAGSDPVGEHQPGPLPERCHRGRPGAAPEAGVLLHLGQPAGHHPAPSDRAIPTCARCPTRRRSSSTTPIPRSPCPS